MERLVFSAKSSGLYLLKMLGLYLNMLESAHEQDAVEERVCTRKENLEIRKKLISVSEPKFRKRYRLSSGLFKQLVDELLPHMPPILRSDALDVESKVSVLQKILQLLKV